MDEEHESDFLSGDEESDGEWTDVEENEVGSLIKKRNLNPVLPHTITKLVTDWGSVVYLVGTAHFSIESQDDVARIIQETQPDVVMVELCSSRINILQLDEKTLLEEAKNINIHKIRSAIKQNGLVQGIMHLLLLSMSAHITKELGMAPGGEFRTAFHEAQKVPHCRLHLGDRPIQITLQRALGSLSIWQKLRLGWYILTSKEPISKEEVENCKQKDLLEEMLKEMTGEFPGLSRVFVEERDIYLSNALKLAAEPIHRENDMPVPLVVVGVVGIGHAGGIVANWEKDHPNMKEIMSVPPPSLVGRIVRWMFRFSFLGLFSWGCYKLYRWILPFIF